jgi:tRNA(Ile)-lysidine synthase
MGAAAELYDEVRAGGLLPAARPVLVMLSGGRDSTCLLDVAAALCGARGVSAVHVNYGLRAAAGEDERHCRDLCRALGVGLEVVHARGAPGPGEGNLQAWARELRYGAAEARAGELDALIASGHTSSDQVETILYRLAASPGRRALLGMPEREGRLIRPLLGVSREQTEAHCRARGLGWREDESNDDERFARARVRHGLLSALRAVHPAAESNVLRTAALLREETRLLEQLIARELRGGEAIALARLAQLEPALARLIVVHLAELAAGSHVPQAGDRVAEILELGARPGGGELHVGGLVAAVVSGGELRMRRLAPRHERTGARSARARRRRTPG